MPPFVGQFFIDATSCSISFTDDGKAKVAFPWLLCLEIQCVEAGCLTLQLQMQRMMIGLSVSMSGYSNAQTAK